MIELRTFGGLELLQRDGGQPRAIPLQAKRLALLTFLAVSPPNSFRRRDSVLALFWPDLDHEHARGALRQALHFIRKSLGDGAITSRGEDEIGLNRALIGSDASRLEGAVDAGDPELALTLYRGDFLEGVFVAEAAPELEDWIAAERSRLKGLAARAAWLASEQSAARGNTGEFVRRAVQLSGDDERALRRGLDTLDQMGDHAGATALYEDFARRVARDLEVGLSAETQAMIHVVRSRRPVVRPPGPPFNASTDIASPSAGDTKADASSEIPPPPAVRIGRKLMIAGAVGALLTFAVATYLSSDRRMMPSPSIGVTAIVPFRVAVADSSLAWLHEGIVELLTIRLTMDGGPRLADPGATLRAWNQAVAEGGPNPGPGLVYAAASRVGAVRVIEGSVTGTSGGVTLAARLSAVPGGVPLSTASVEGSPDSLSELLDLLAARLLGLGAGVDASRLFKQLSTPLPAMRAFVAGQSAYRAGRMAAAGRYLFEAVDLDSSFALAGLQLARAAGWTRQVAQVERGLTVANAGRARLGPADRAVLDAMLGDWRKTPGPITRWTAVVTGYPDVPEGWYSLGDAHWHLGVLAGEGNALERAGAAFHRGWQLDSAAGAGPFGGGSVAEPVLHMVELAHLRGDTAAVLRMVSQVLAADSTTDLARTLMWHRALVTSDSARRAFWSASADMSQISMMWINLFVTWTGVGAVDLAALQAADADRLRVHDPGFATFAFASMALNSGRPSAVPPPPGSGVGDVARTGPRARIRRALWWDGDTLVALIDERLLAASMNRTAGSAEAGREQLFDICTIGEWRARRGDLVAARTASSRLRAARLSPQKDSAPLARYASLCASLLDATNATGLGLPEARRRVATADSLATTYVYEICCGEAVNDANLQLASLWMQLGDAPRALAAVRRGGGQFGEAPHYLSTFLREEGRLALLTGDTTGALRAYRHYLALRPNPDPQLKPGVDSIRQALAVLEAR